MWKMKYPLWAIAYEYVKYATPPPTINSIMATTRKNIALAFANSGPTEDLEQIIHNIINATSVLKKDNNLHFTAMWTSGQCILQHIKLKN